MNFQEEKCKKVLEKYKVVLACSQRTITISYIRGQLK